MLPNRANSLPNLCLRALYVRQAAGLSLIWKEADCFSYGSSRKSATVLKAWRLVGQRGASVGLLVF
jgi:hypothetical protein